jgi:uncharacterized protein (DUF1330 family)
MTVYAIIEIRILYEEPYFEYVKNIRFIVEHYNGRYLARGGKVTPLFGDWNPERIIVIEFPSIEDLMNCFGSDEYKKIAPLREHSTITRSIIVEGCSFEQ